MPKPHSSGPGKVDVYADTELILAALLYNFDIDSPNLKNEHFEWIRTHVQPRLAYESTKCLVVAFASRTGPEVSNLNLSSHRADSVGAAIWIFDPARETGGLVKEYFHGEEAAKLAGEADGVEDARWRAVYVMVYRSLNDLLPPLPGRHFIGWVRRRTVVKYIWKIEEKGISTADPQDKRAQDAAALGKQLGDIAGIAPNPETEQFEMVQDNWGLREISTSRDKTNIGLPSVEDVNVTYVSITYRYGLPDGKPVKKRGKYLSPDEVSDWMDDPYTTYARDRYTSLGDD